MILKTIKILLLILFCGLTALSAQNLIPIDESRVILKPRMRFTKINKGFIVLDDTKSRMIFFGDSGNFIKTLYHDSLKKQTFISKALVQELKDSIKKEDVLMNEGDLSLSFNWAISNESGFIVVGSVSYPRYDTLEQFKHQTRNSAGALFFFDENFQCTNFELLFLFAKQYHQYQPNYWFPILEIPGFFSSGSIFMTIMNANSRSVKDQSRALSKIEFYSKHNELEISTFGILSDFINFDSLSVIDNGGIINPSFIKTNRNSSIKDLVVIHAGGTGINFNTNERFELPKHFYYETGLFIKNNPFYIFKEHLTPNVMEPNYKYYIANNFKCLDPTPFQIPEGTEIMKVLETNTYFASEVYFILRKNETLYLWKYTG